MIDGTLDANVTRLECAQPLISIITVVFNGERHLEQTIQNILNQDYTNIEYVIIDGGSTDKTINIIRRYENQIAYWNSEIDNGIYDAMNKGMRASTGDYVMFLNAGDSFANRETLKQVVKKIATNNWPDVVYGNANILSEKGQFIKELKPLQFTKLNITLFGTRTVCHQSVLVKKSIAPFYSTDYRLKGELAWYYDIFKIKPHPRFCKINLTISNYLLGGLSDNLFSKEIIERIKVIADKNGISCCLISIPFLLIPVLFRMKRKLVSKMLHVG
jgi:glycosyltransferase involved in cell wall biosynthesis